MQLLSTSAVTAVAVVGYGMYSYMDNLEPSHDQITVHLLPCWFDNLKIQCLDVTMPHMPRDRDTIAVFNFNWDNYEEVKGVSVQYGCNPGGH